MDYWDYYFIIMDLCYGKDFIVHSALMEYMNVIIGLSIGIIFGLYVSLDLILMKKRNWFGFSLRGLSISFILNIPQAFKGLNSGVYETLSFALLAFTISVLLGAVTSYCFYNKLRKDYKNHTEVFLRKVITYWDLFYSGYGGLKEDIKQAILDDEREKQNNNRALLKTMNRMGDDVADFLIKIYGSAFVAEDPLSYSLSVLESFVSKFLSETSANFTIRKYNAETKEMVCLLTTKSNIPSPIPLDKTNMITKSMEMKQPLIYTKNKSFDFPTANRGGFRDYVTFCLLTDASGKIPLFSVNLTVKDAETQKKMFAFVNTKIFQVVCEPIKKRLKQYAEKEGLL